VSFAAPVVCNASFDLLYLSYVAETDLQTMTVPDACSHSQATFAAHLVHAHPPQVTTSSDVAVSLMYMHPGSNAELDFLLGAGGGNRKRYKRRRGERGQPGKTGLATVGETLSLYPF